MIVGCLVIYLFAVLLNKVSMEVSVTGHIGENAVLDCSYKADKNKVHVVNWMYNHTHTVYEFSPGSSQSKPDNEKFESFPKEYADGIYSIKIKKLKQTDQGMYTCIITPADYYTNIQLIVEPKSPHQSFKDTTETNIEEGNKKTQKPLEHVTTVCVVVAVLLFVVILLIVCIKKGYVVHTRKMYASCCLRSDY
ncbi:CD276 antigen-like isoform X1 [Triplophysa rosa]|uniref:CD276 antigen-like isoform X1 n=1 Tax=Triplophysa rosa TaxID=992332 RepID=UPI00254633B7|nr:CD276 antigen-like isoform X1 [Triplophysa rosa]